MRHPNEIKASRRTIVALAALVTGLVLASIGSAAGPGQAGAVAVKPTLVISPAPGHGAYRDGQNIKVSVGPNKYFAPYSRVNILECADPKGKAANLPTSLNTCDPNTIQGDTVLVQKDGSFVEKSYPVYELPNRVLGEQSNWQPVCNRTHPCVLYVGANQDNFTRPKVLSAPFTVVPSTSPHSVAGGSS